MEEEPKRKTGIRTCLNSGYNNNLRGLTGDLDEVVGAASVLEGELGVGGGPGGNAGALVRQGEGVGVGADRVLHAAEAGLLPDAGVVA